MAQAVVDTSDRRIFGRYDWGRVAMIGAGLGFVVWVLTWAIGNFVVDPLVCRSGELAACAQSDVLAGNIAAVVGAVVGAGALIRLMVHRAIGVALATLIAFWNIGTIHDGLGWFETVVWMVVLYALSYLLFANIMRIRSVFVAAIVAIVAVLVVRWVAFL